MQYVYVQVCGMSLRNNAILPVMTTELSATRAELNNRLTHLLVTYLSY